MSREEMGVMSDRGLEEAMSVLGETIVRLRRKNNVMREALCKIATKASREKEGWLVDLAWEAHKAGTEDRE
jgi:hypothetical protein